MRYYLILYLFVILFLCIIYQPYPIEFFDNSNNSNNSTYNHNLIVRTNEDEKLINGDIKRKTNTTGIDINSYNSGLNMFDIRDIRMNKLRSELISNHELVEKSFNDLINASLNQDVSFDCDVFKNTTYYRQIEGEFSGIDKCMKECDGKCLPYGYTGSAWCFHKNNK